MVVGALLGPNSHVNEVKYFIILWIVKVSHIIYMTETENLFNTDYG